MANSDKFLISDNAVMNATYSCSNNDDVIFGDSSVGNVISHHSSSDTTSFKDIAILNISDFIKKVSPDCAIFDDTAQQRIIFRNTIEENTIYEDSSYGKVHTSQIVEDVLNVNDVPYGIVHTSQNSSDTAILTDEAILMQSYTSNRTFKNAFFNSLGTTEETVYTCSGRSSTIISMSICNITSADIEVNVMFYRGASRTYYQQEIVIPPYIPFVINKNDYDTIILQNTDEIRLISNTTASADVYISLLEQS
jgi:hypothetical protein